MTYEQKLQKFTAGKQFHPASGERGHLSLHTGDKTPGCAACGSKRAYYLVGLEDEAGNFYWVGYDCARYILWLQDEAAQGQVAQLRAEQLQREELLKTERREREQRQTNECQHLNTKWIPERPDAGCEEGKWVCLNCGAEKQKAYRPILETWKGGRDKALARLSVLKPREMR